MKIRVMPDGEVVPVGTPYESPKYCLEVDFGQVNRTATIAACMHIVDRLTSDDQITGLSIENVNREAIDCLHDLFVGRNRTYGIFMEDQYFNLHSIQAICSMLIHELCNVTYISFTRIPDDGTEWLGAHLHQTKLTGLCLGKCNVNRSLCGRIIDAGKIVRLAFRDIRSLDIDALCEVVTRAPLIQDLGLWTYLLEQTDLMKLCDAIQSAPHFQSLDVCHRDSEIYQADIDCFVDVLRIHPSFKKLTYARDGEDNDDSNEKRTDQAVKLIKFRYVILTLVSGIQNKRLFGVGKLHLLPVELIRVLVTFLV
jgi:hypothetical protein